jgi:hypothetical protein
MSERTKIQQRILDLVAQYFPKSGFPDHIVVMGQLNIATQTMLKIKTFVAFAFLTVKHWR